MTNVTNATNRDLDEAMKTASDLLFNASDLTNGFVVDTDEVRTNGVTYFDESGNAVVVTFWLSGKATVTMKSASEMENE